MSECDWSPDVCSSDLQLFAQLVLVAIVVALAGAASPCNNYFQEKECRNVKRAYRKKLTSVTCIQDQQGLVLIDVDYTSLLLIKMDLPLFGKG